MNGKLRNFMENIVCIPFKLSNHLNNKSGQCLYHVTHLKRKNRKQFCKNLCFMHFVAISDCWNLRAFSLPSTWSSSILPFLSFPLKPYLTLCHPLGPTIRIGWESWCLLNAGFLYVWFNVFTTVYDAIALSYLGWILPLEEIGQSLNQRNAIPGCIPKNFFWTQSPLEFQTGTAKNVSLF